MSTRANIVITDDVNTLYFYRHSDGYPDCTGKDLLEFVKGYTNQSMRDNPSQSAGWLVIRGHVEYYPKWRYQACPDDKAYGWKVGAYEPTNSLHGDVEYIYVIHLKERRISCERPNAQFWDHPILSNTEPCFEFQPTRF